MLYSSPRSIHRDITMVVKDYARQWQPHASAVTLFVRVDNPQVGYATGA